MSVHCAPALSVSAANQEYAKDASRTGMLYCPVSHLLIACTVTVINKLCCTAHLLADLKVLQWDYTKDT